MTIRRLLDGLYLAAGAVAALLLAGTLVMVLAGIGARLMGIHIAGTDAYAGYCMAGAGFLALAHTLKRGEHIRVSLLLDRAGDRMQRALDLWSLAVAALLSGLFAFYSVRLSLQSWQFNDISTGNDATPLWIPQLAMAAGTVILLVAVVDELVLELRGKRPRSRPGEALHVE